MQVITTSGKIFQQHRSFNNVSIPGKNASIFIFINGGLFLFYNCPFLNSSGLNHHHHHLLSNSSITVTTESTSSTSSSSAVTAAAAAAAAAAASGSSLTVATTSNGAITSTGPETEILMAAGVGHHRNKRMLQCLFCGIEFPDQTLYFLHKGCHSESNPWKCNICGEQCNNVYEFNSHLLSKSHQWGWADRVCSTHTHTHLYKANLININ